MIDILAMFLLYKFEAAWYWWSAFIVVAIIRSYGEYTRWGKIEQYLDNAEKEYNIRKQERKEKEPHIYLGGIND
jgi:hypothetical protein